MTAVDSGNSQSHTLHLRPCKHQVAGHLFEEGKAGSLVDDSGHFYKPLQVGPRGTRETKFYERITRELLSEKVKGYDDEDGEEDGKDPAMPEAEELYPAGVRRQLATSTSGRKSESDDREFREQRFSKRHATVLKAIPRFYGLVQLDGSLLLELEDVARKYRHPSIVDIKVGRRTWYPFADPRHIERCKLKDAATTQAALGFKICGMQVYRHSQKGYWRASKRWCKGLPLDSVSSALLRFTNNEALTPADVYGGPKGAIAQLQQLEQWFQKQREFFFYSSSVLIIYEGGAENAEQANVAIRLVDFAHTFHADDLKKKPQEKEKKKDTNFIAGLCAIIEALTTVMRLDSQKDELGSI